VVVNGGSAPYTYIWSNGQTVDGFCGLAAGTYIVTVSDNGGGGSGFDTLYQEGFEAAHNWTLNVSTGVNGVDNNFWTVSDAEGGVLPSGCGVGGNGNKTLHITSVFFPTGGAAYDAGGFCGVLFCPETNMRAESPAFSTVGANNTSLSFDFISNGQALLDNASVWYNSGTGWTQLVNSIKSPVCVSGQGEWTNFTVPLPASCNNNPNVQVAFNWTNNDDGVGTDPSVAVNNVLVYNSGPVTVSCSGTDTVVIAQPAVLASNTVNITDANCSSPGAINIAVSGGTAPYSFLWSNGVTSEDITGLNAGSYSVSITDANGCNVVNAANTVNASGLPAITVSSSVDPTCNGYNDGSISLNVSGGSAPYSFNWNAGLNGQNLSGLDGGIYNVTVTDALGCTSTLSSITLTEPAAIVLSSIVLTDANCENSDGSINYTVSGGAGTPFSFNWSNSATTQNLTGLSSGTYNLTVTDANGCNQPDTFSINAPFVPTLAAFIGQTGVSDSTIIQGESISVNVGNDESALGVSYQWLSVPSTANFANDSAAATLVAPDPFGNYILNVIASSAGGCTAIDTLTLTVQSPDNPKIPTAFSPNGDNNNDNFFVIDLNLEYLKEFKIFNRWGQVVYDNTTQAKWDGKLNGADQPRDVYLYIITWQRPNDIEPVVNRGSLTLFR
jgi:gliding motility-associated-like protein